MRKPSDSGHTSETSVLKDILGFETVRKNPQD
jgi:hypothetical protein